MRFRHGPLLAVLLAVPVGAADPPGDDILLPVTPAVPAPMPGTATRLGRGERFVIQSKGRCDIEVTPEGSVSVAEKVGPRDWTAIFAGGTGDYEDRHFSYPHLYALSAAKTGTCTVLVVPNGAKDRSAWRKFTLDVDAGTGPQPPPVPIPVPVDPLTQALQAAYAADKDTDKSKQLPVLAEVLGSVIAAARASGKVATTKQLQDAVHQATDLAVGAGKLAETRKAVGAYLVTKLGTQNQNMTDAIWATAAAEYAAVSNALKGVR